MLRGALAPAATPTLDWSPSRKGSPGPDAGCAGGNVAVSPGLDWILTSQVHLANVASFVHYSVHLLAVFCVFILPALVIRDDNLATEQRKSAFWSIKKDVEVKDKPPVASSAWSKVMKCCI